MRRVNTHDELLELSDDDPWIRWAINPALPGEVWVDERVALIERLGDRRGFWVSQVRDPLTAEDVRRGVTFLRDGGHLERLESRSVSVPQDQLAVAEQVLDLDTGGDWEWMWTTQEPAVDPREGAIVELDDLRDGPEILAFSRAHNHRVWTEIGVGKVDRWLGLRRTDGELVAVGGYEAGLAGVPHLVGIVTATELRGQGLGHVVSAALTREAVRQAGMSTLGFFSDNDAARAVYSRLGYQVARAWSSRRLATMGAPQ